MTPDQESKITAASRSLCNMDMKTKGYEGREEEIGNLTVQLIEAWGEGDYEGCVRPLKQLREIYRELSGQDGKEEQEKRDRRADEDSEHWEVGSDHR